MGKDSLSRGVEARKEDEMDLLKEIAEGKEFDVVAAIRALAKEMIKARAAQAGDKKRIVATTAQPESGQGK